MNYKNKSMIKYGAIGIIIILVGVWLFTYLAAPIKTIHSFNEINFNKIKPGTLVIFDVDETLIQPLDSYYINEHTPQAHEFRKKLFMKHPEIKNWDIYADITLKEVKRPLIEPMVISKIKELEGKGVYVIACTAMNTGKFGTLERLEAWRYEHLASLGFQGHFGDLIIDLSLENRKPVFYKGILATDLLTKGLVVFAFLDHIHLIPKEIVMVDDSIEFLESMLQECKKRNISYQGYLYQGARQKFWDKKLIEFQSEYLIKHKKWLSDNEARAILAKSSQSML